MSKPNPTKRIATKHIDKVVMIRDESDERELLAFENADAASLFEGCLNDSGYGSAYGGYEVEWPSMDDVRKTRGYEDWLKNGQRVISLAYMNYVSERMDADEECDASYLLNMEMVKDGYAPMSLADWETLYPEECEDTDEAEEVFCD
jgi:hypothetical protein